MTQNSNQVTLTATPDRFLFPAEQANDRYILLTLKTPERETQTDRLPLNLSLIIDRSGSMRGKKLEYVKEAVTYVLRALTTADRASVVIYDDEIELLAESQALSSDIRKGMIDKVRQVRPGGMTNLSGGWFKGCEQITEYFSQDYINRAFLLTDGLANKGMTDHERLVYEAKQFRKQGISTTTFGVGDDFNEFLLQGIADGGNGHFYFIDAPNQIPNYFEGELGEMLTTVAREITLDINLPTGVTAKLVNQIPTETDNNRLRVLLGDSYSGDERLLVLKISLPKCELRRQITIEFKLQYEDAQQRQAITVQADPINLSAVSQNAYHQQAVNQTVLAEATRLEITEAKIEALNHGRYGKIDAVKAVVSKARQLLANVLPESEVEAQMAELEQLADQLEIGMSRHQSKAAHYHTHMARHSRSDYRK